MDFNSLNSDTECDCLKETFVDNDTILIRKINKSKLQESDFASHWEKGKRNFTDCKGECSLRGVSLSTASGDSDKQKVIESYKKVFPLSPKYRPYVCLLKLKNGAGRLKNTPSKNVVNHHDFYKSDGFDLNRVETIEILPIHDA